MLKNWLAFGNVFLGFVSVCGRFLLLDWLEVSLFALKLQLIPSPESTLTPKLHQLEKLNCFLLAARSCSRKHGAQ